MGDDSAKPREGRAGEPDNFSPRLVGPYTYILFLLRVPLIATLVLVSILTDLVIPGSMREALRYSIMDAQQQLPIIVAALALACAAVRFCGEAVVGLVSPELYEASRPVRFFVRAAPRAFAVLLGMAPGVPLLTLAFDPDALGSLSNQIIAGVFGALFIAVGLIVGLVLKGPQTIRGDDSDDSHLGPSAIFRWIIALLPVAMAALFCGVVLGAWQEGTGIAFEVGSYPGAIAQLLSAGTISARVLAEIVALFAICIGARVAVAIFIDLVAPRIANAGGFWWQFRLWLPRLASTGIGVALAAEVILLALHHPAAIQMPEREKIGAWAWIGGISAAFVAVGVVTSLGGAHLVQSPNRVGARWIVAAERMTAMNDFWQWTLAIFLVLSAGIFLIFADVTHVAVAQTVGPIAILLLWGLTATALFSPIAYLGHMTRVPLLLIILISGVAYAGFDLNDNHSLRRVDVVAGAPAGASGYRESFDLGKWMASRQDWKHYDRYPIFLVATEGGGIRAAYFTTTVLAALQERCPAFAQHTIAISGVSGGSLGAAVFAALAADHAHNNESARCALQGRPPGDLVKEARKALSTDLLSPLLGAALFPDALQRILPLRVDQFDRSRALEYAVEDAWRNAAVAYCATCDKNRMSEDVAALYTWNPKDPRMAVPHLFVNTTEAGTGRSIPFATMQLHGMMTQSVADSEIDYSGEQQANMYSLQDYMDAGEDHVPLSAAAIISARFPYLTPAGRVGFHHHHYVDGGYWENSGTSLLSRVIQNLIGAKMAYKNPTDPELENAVRNAVFVTIVVHSEPCTRNALYGQCEEDDLSARDDTSFNELLSPLRALLSTRDQRAAYAVDDLTALTALIEQISGAGTVTTGTDAAVTGKEDDTGCYNGLCAVTLRYCNKLKVEVPLSWLLSHYSRDAMDDAVTKMEATDVRKTSLTTRTLECNGDADDGSNRILGSYRRVICLLDGQKDAQSCVSTRL